LWPGQVATSRQHFIELKIKHRLTATAEYAPAVGDRSSGSRQISDSLRVNSHKLPVEVFRRARKPSADSRSFAASSGNGGMQHYSKVVFTSNLLFTDFSWKVGGSNPGVPPIVHVD
jgi:hypothetical protein